MPNPPLGLLYLASFLREHGHLVSILDCAIIKKSYNKIISQIKRINPDAIGITALSAYYPEMRRLAKLLHGLEIPLILGGVHVSALPELSLRECKADFAVIGEGELTTLELLDKWDDEEGRKKVKGIAYLEKSEFKLNPNQELIKNLDELPFPAWDLINLKEYPPTPHGYQMKRYPVAPIFTTRGCPFSCDYCASTNFWGSKFRSRSPQNVVDELEYLINNFGIREIHIWDDNFTLRRKHVLNICKEILRRKLDLTFACPNGVRIDYLDKEILTIMRRAGFYALTFAVESGSQSILNKSNKRVDLRIIPKTVKLAKKMGYYIPAYFIFGLPGETYETARRSIQFAKSIPFDRIAFFVAQPLPGSKHFNDLIQNDPSKIRDFQFCFFIYADQLELSDGKRKLILPRDAYREFVLRPSQIFRILKVNIKFFNRRQLLMRLRETLPSIF
jgi:radical SAM superfamily enzyme YgiQ (UPF0313 family)